MIDLFLRAESEAELQSALAGAGIGTLTTSFLNQMATSPLEVLTTVQIPTMIEATVPGITGDETRLVQAMTTTEVSFVGMTMTQQVGVFTVAEVTSLTYPLTETTVQLASFSVPTTPAFALDILGTISRQVGTELVGGMTLAVFEPLSGYHANLRLVDEDQAIIDALAPITINRPNQPHRVWA